MKILIYSIITGFFFIASGNATPELFTQAVESYQNKDYSKAYNKLITLQEKNNAVYELLGDCAQELKKKGEAVLFWRKAQVDGGLSRLIRIEDKIKNLTTEQEGQKSGVLSILRTAKQFYLALIRAVPLINIQVLFLFLWIIMLMYTRYMYRRKQRFLIVFIFSLLACVSMILAQKYNIFHKKHGVVIQDAGIYSGPAENYTKLMVVPQGTEGLELNKNNSFSKIRTHLGAGWIKTESFEVF